MSDRAALALCSSWKYS